ncbi:hypothetical protein GCM10027063_11120 [Promicromonospora xylanilytica]
MPAINQEMSAPSTPVSPANRLGSEKTPAPTIEPTTMAVRVATLIVAALCCVLLSGCCAIARPLMRSSTVRSPG